MGKATPTARSSHQRPTPPTPGPEQSLLRSGTRPGAKGYRTRPGVGVTRTYASGSAAPIVGPRKQRVPPAGAAKNGPGPHILSKRTQKIAGRRGRRPPPLARPPGRSPPAPLPR